MSVKDSPWSACDLFAQANRADDVLGEGACGYKRCAAVDTTSNLSGRAVSGVLLAQVWTVVFLVLDVQRCGAQMCAKMSLHPMPVIGC
jgi:hypothetical protein